MHARRYIHGQEALTAPLLLASAFTVAADVDVFGITRLYPSRSPALEWTSQHWAQGGRRTMDVTDPQDPTGWSRKRGQTTLMEVDGAGVLRMGGPQARLYFQSSATRTFFSRDVEVTGYFRRVGSDGASNGGFVVGVRSGQEGHGGINCLANTYYLAFRYPGTWAFAKELNHPESVIGRSGSLFSGSFPTGRWIGMKFVAYNLPGNRAVKLEAYLDEVSNGNPVNGGTWKKVAEIVDDGNIPAPVGSCGYPANTVVTTGGGVVFIRNTDAAEANYKMLTIHEISLTPTRLAALEADARRKPILWGREGGSIRFTWTPRWNRAADGLGRLIPDSGPAPTLDP